MKKKKHTVIVLAAAFLLITAFSFGQAPQLRRPQLRAVNIQYMLDLTPEQAEQLRQLRMDHQMAQQVLMDRIRLLSLENRQLMREPEANFARIKELRGQIFQLREQQFDQMLRHREERNALLTPEQLEKVKVLESRRAMQRPAQRRPMSRGGRFVRPRAGMRGGLAGDMYRDGPEGNYYRPMRNRRDLIR
jgi:hypothetical protein